MLITDLELRLKDGQLDKASSLDQELDLKNSQVQEIEQSIELWNNDLEQQF
jgi:hypothetical protein